MVESFHSNLTGGPCYLGLKPVRAGVVQFKLRDYVDFSTVNVPRSFGFIDNAADYKMLANDRCGCCVVSGAAHEHAIWTRAARQPPAGFDDASVVNEYRTASGWNGIRNDPSDTGLDMEIYARRRRSVGIIDANHVAHNVVAYADIGKSFDNIAKAVYIFGAVGLGVRVPQSALVQFNMQQPWSVMSGSNVMGAHYLPAVGLNSPHDLVGVTWGRLQAIEETWIETFVEIAIAYITDDFLEAATGKSPRYFDRANLDSDLAALAA